MNGIIFLIDLEVDQSPDSWTRPSNYRILPGWESATLFWYCVCSIHLSGFLIIGTCFLVLLNDPHGSARSNKESLFAPSLHLVDKIITTMNTKGSQNRSLKPTIKHRNMQRVIFKTDAHVRAAKKNRPDGVKPLLSTVFQNPRAFENEPNL